MAQSNESDTWTKYYNAVTGRSVRPLLLNVLTRFQQPGYALDLGCGDGTETLALLEAGWHVLAIDKHPEAIARLKEKVPARAASRLETRVIAFENISLPTADLIYAGFSLPFCKPAHFAKLWNSIETSLGNTGRFAGQLFGERDSWAADPNMTFHTLEQVRGLFENFDIEVFKQVDEDGQAVSGPKHWHFYNIIAKKTMNNQ
jgi:tellurite methyltransferase